MTGRSWTLMRDIARGKHHMTYDQQTTLCRRPVYGFWESGTPSQWAEEDCCKNCLRLSVDARSQTP